MPYAPNRLLDFDGIGQRSEGVTYTLLNRDKNAIGKVTPVIDASTPSITMDVSQKMTRQLSGMVLTRSDYVNINPFTDLVGVEWVLEDGSSWPLGVFYFTGDPTNRDLVNLTPLADGTILVDQGIDHTFGADKGSLITWKLWDLARQCGIYLFTMDDVQRHIGEPIVWPAGTSYLQMMENLCALAGFWPPFFDASGTLNLIDVPKIEKTKTTFPGDHLMLARSDEENRNLLNIPNVHIVTGNGPTEGELTAFAQVDQSLPWSVKNRGRRITKIHNYQGMTSTDQAQQIANRLAQIATSDFAEITFSTPPDPRHDVHDTIEVRGTIYREVSWTLPLKAGSTMTHRATRAGTIG